MGALATRTQINYLAVTDGVIMLRPMTPYDVIPHVAGVDREQVRWLGGFPTTHETVLAWIEGNAEHWANGGPIYNFGVVERATNQLVGMVDANTEADEMDGVADGEANISYVIYPHARGRHFATRAVNLLLPFLDEKGFTPVIRAAPENGPSLGVAKSCGFLRTGQVFSNEVTGWTKLNVFHRTLGVTVNDLVRVRSLGGSL